MDKKNEKSEKISTDDGANGLENKVGVLGRLKYVAVPAVITLGSCFIPELKQKYHNSSTEKQDDYLKLGLIGTGVVGITLAAFSGYKLYKQHNEKYVKNNLS